MPRTNTRHFSDSTEADSFVEWTEVTNNPCSPQISLTPGRSTAVRTVDVSWYDWYRFACHVVGYSTIGTSRNGKAFVSRHTPWRFPLLNDANRYWLWVNDFRAEGRGIPTDSQFYEGFDDTAVAKYNHARCTLQYATRTYDVLTDQTFYDLEPTQDEASLRRYVTKIVRPQGEFLTLEGTSYYYAGYKPGGVVQPLSQGINKTLVSFNVALTWHLIPEAAIPCSFWNPNGTNLAIDNCLGRVNKYPIGNFAKGTLLLTACEIKPDITPLGDRVFDITYMFKFFNPSAEVKGGGEHDSHVAGHQHIFFPRATVVSPTNTGPGWYEAVQSQTLAGAATSTNFIAMTPSINIYDWATMQMLFRPATFSGDGPEGPK